VRAGGVAAALAAVARGRCAADVTLIAWEERTGFQSCIHSGIMWLSRMLAERNTLDTTNTDTHRELASPHRGARRARVSSQKCELTGKVSLLYRLITRDKQRPFTPARCLAALCGTSAGGACTLFT